MREDFYEHVKYWKTQFAELKEAYMTLFGELYEFDVSDAYWIGNVLYVADYFIGLYDIMYAVNNCIGEEQFFEWYDYNLTLGNYFLDDVSLENYSKGILPYSKEDVKMLSDLQNDFTKTKIAIDDLLVEMKKNKPEQKVV